MKRILLIFIVLLFASTTLAQTQQGIVKTRGRVVNGQVVAGQRLTGATITLSLGNPQVSLAQGAFSFNVPAGKSYSLVSATKQGYTLADPEYTRRTFKYSAGNPFYVVLEDEAQRQADIKEATDKVRKTLKRELRKREDELDELRESNAITQTKYDSLRLEFATYRQSSEALVNEMAQRFAAIDYDQLDEFNRQVQQYIEEGELLKADSLINTRGSLEERYARVKEQESVNTQRKEEIRQQQKSLAKSQELTQREKEDLMSDLYAKHTIYLQAYQQDSALYCLKMRADLDTTMLSNVREYADMAFGQDKLFEAEITYNKLLKTYKTQKDTLNVAAILYKLGQIHDILDNDSLCVDYYTRSVKWYESLCLNSQNTISLVSVYLALAKRMSARKTGSAVEGKKMALAYCEETERLMKSMNFEELGELQIDFIGFLLQEGIIYRNVLSYSHLEELFAEDGGWDPIFIQDRERYIQNISNIINIARTHIDECVNLKLEHNLSKYANIMFRLHLLHKSVHNDSLVHQSLMESTNIYETLYERNPDAYRRQLASQYYCLRSFVDSISAPYYTDKALSFYEDLNEQFPGSFSEELYWLYVDEYKYATDQQNFFQAVEYTRKLVKIGMALGFVATALKNLALSYKKSGKYKMALQCIEEAIEVNASECKDASDVGFLQELNDFTIKLYITKGEILLMQGRNDEALEMWKKVLELNPDFLDNYPDGTNLSNGLKKLGLIE